MTTANDTIDRLAGLTDQSPVFATRRQRDKVAIATQACEDLLLGDGLADSLSRAERLVLASEQCRVSGVQALADEYRQRAESLGDALTPALRTVLAQPGAQTGNARLDAALHFVRTLALHPAESDRAALLAMPESGLSIDDTVLVAQLVGFIAYQLRLFAGVQAMVALGGQAQGQLLRGRALVIASGVRARGLPGHPFGAAWPGVLVGPGSPIVAQDYSGLKVAVLGGGDNAYENFVYVRNRGAGDVHLYARTVRAQQQWVTRAGCENVHVGAYEVDPAARTVGGRRYDLILVFYGWEPQAAFADGLRLARSERGYIQTDFATAQTSLPDIYAIGEVANRMHPCVVTAMADGVVAAKDIQRRWERVPQRRESVT